MPELPEVETIARTLRPQVCGKEITDTRVLLPRVIQSGRERLPLLPGARIAAVGRRAKLLLVGLDLPLNKAPDKAPALGGASPSFAPDSLPADLRDAGLLLVFHLKMTGSFFLHPAGAPPLKHTRLIFDLGPDGSLFFDDTRTFGYCRLMRPSELPNWSFWAKLGPEPLGLPPEALAAHFATAFAGRRSAVKSLLLNQEIVAGVGNIYADESLFQAGIAPTARAGDIPPARLEALAAALQAILRQSIEECGSSIRDYRDALGNAGAFQNSFAVYGRKGERCTRCGAPLAHARVAGRATVYCPKCQL